MNWQHLQALIWLRWRLLVNQTRRAGGLGAVFLLLLVIGAGTAGMVMFGISLLLGVTLLPAVSPEILMYIWDGLVVVFLFFWAIGVMTDLQRSELLSLDRLLHLPISPTGAFLMNYLASMLSLSLILFLPTMIGLCIAMVFAKGPAMLVLFPLLAAFLLMVTALTYQFRGWLAALMVNKRRRRTVIVLITIGFLLLVQLPNLLAQMIQPWDRTPDPEAVVRRQEELSALSRDLQAGTIDHQQYYEQFQAIHRKYDNEAEEHWYQKWRQVAYGARLANIVLPIGWLPYGAMASAEGNLLPAILGTLGLTLIGAASLWRSYRTTLRLYTGGFTGGQRKTVAATPPVKTAKPGVGLLERTLPFLSEHASAIATAGFRSLTRAPEMKMALLSVIVLVVIFGGMMVARSWVSAPMLTRPLMACGAISMTLLSMAQFMGNQFGYDRSGFRAYVLCAAPRREILLGKNLAHAPVALGMAAFLVIVLQFLHPMRIDHFLAMWPQMVSMYFAVCVVANLMSIFVPMAIAPGAMRPAQAKAAAILPQLLFSFLFPLVLTPTLLPLGVALLLEWLVVPEGVPIWLILSVAECAVVLYVYRLVLAWEGKLLQSREQKILDVLTTRME